MTFTSLYSPYSGNDEAYVRGAAHFVNARKPYDDVTFVDSYPRPEPLGESTSCLSPDRASFINPAIQGLKNQINHLRNIVDKFEFEPSPADPLQEEKNIKRDRCLIPLACVPGVGGGVTIFKEVDFAEKLKNTFDEKERASLLKKQKEFRVSSMVRTIISVALAVLMIAIALFTGGVSVAVGLGLLGAACAIGSGFIGLNAGLLHDSNKKMRALGPVELPTKPEEQGMAAEEL